MVPIQGERAHFLYFLEFSKSTEQQQQTYQFTQGYNILHRLQVHHLTLIFIIHNKYISFIRECGSTLYVGLARTAPPTNTNFRLTFLLTRLQEDLYEDLAV